MKLEIKMKIRNEYGQSCETVWTEYKRKMNEIETFFFSLLCHFLTVLWFTLAERAIHCTLVHWWNGRKTMHEVEIKLWLSSVLFCVSWKGKRTIKFEWFDFHIVNVTWALNRIWVDWKHFNGKSIYFFLHWTKCGMKSLIFSRFRSVGWLNFHYASRVNQFEKLCKFIMKSVRFKMEFIEILSFFRKFGRKWNET